MVPDSRRFGDELTGATCRVALAALLHDLGKLTERAAVFNLESGMGRDNVHLYCPYHREGNYHSHNHAAATALSLDEIEHLLPPVLAGEIAPFVPRGAGDVTDSFINAAAGHHKPDTFLQWCVAVADRVASGFEREKFEEYNRQKGEHVVEQLLVPFETFGRPDAASKSELKWRYPLDSLSVGALFPQRFERQADRPEAAAAYKRLWEALKDGLQKIPEAHRRNWPLWLDAFDTLWLTTAHAVPSASSFGVKASVSLYDHSRAAAAFAAALWRYHYERGDDPVQVAARQASRADWGDNKFLLIQGDFTGIQNFIFGGSASTQKAAAKLLRGRSALVSILCELAALKTLDALSLAPTSQVINAAGKFLIVAPNTAECAERLKGVRADLDRWFLKASFGLASVVLSAEPASCNDFIGEQFAQARRRLALGLDRAKRQRFDLAGDGAPDPLLATDFSQGVCPFDGRLPAEADCRLDGTPCAPLSADQIDLGAWLARADNPLLRITRSDGSRETGGLRSDFFGYRIVMSETGGECVVPVALADFRPVPAGRRRRENAVFRLCAEGYQCLCPGHETRKRGRPALCGRRRG
jgi:CRISPR-associated protein Csm1